MASRFTLAIFTAFGVFGIPGCSNFGVKSPVPERGGELQSFLALKPMESAPAALQAASKAVVKIALPQHSGTGFFVSDDGRFVTNNHVLGAESCAREGCYAELLEDFQWGTRSRRTLFFFKPIAVSPALDVAVHEVFETENGVKTDKRYRPAAFLQFAEKSAADLRGSTVYEVGHPHGQLKKWSSGKVLQNSDNWFTWDGFSLPGNSGSPVLNDAGQVVGIHHRGSQDKSLVTRAQQVSYLDGTSSKAILELMSKVPNKPGLGLLVSIEESKPAAAAASQSYIYNIARSPTFYDETGTRASVLDALSQACEANLAKTDYDGPETAYERLSVCSQSLLWFNCIRRDLHQTFKQCDAKKAAQWTALFQRSLVVVEEFRDSLDLVSWSVYYPALLTSPESYYREVDSRYRKLSPKLQGQDVFYLAKNSLWFVDDDRFELFEGQSPKDLLLNYDKQKAYQHAFGDIIEGTMELWYRKILKTNEVKPALHKIFNDPLIPLRYQLAVEVDMYKVEFMQK